MSHQISIDDLVRYLYRETSPAESRLIREALKNDQKLEKDYKKMAEAKKILEQNRISPGEKTTKRIIHSVRKEPEHPHEH